MIFPKLQNTAKNRVFINKNVWSGLGYNSLLALAFAATSVFAQESYSGSQFSPSLIFSAEVSGFIPIRETYRLNYESELAGLPIEVAANMQFPIDHRFSAGLGARYRRRTVTFVPGVSLRALELEPGVQYYLEDPLPSELHLIGDVGLILTRVTIAGPIEGSSDGQNFQEQHVEKDYYNLGFGVGLALEYPLADLSSLFAHLHLSTFMLDPIDRGGLGNIGGISIGIGYKIWL